MLQTVINYTHHIQNCRRCHQLLTNISNKIQQQRVQIQSRKYHIYNELICIYADIENEKSHAACYDQRS